MSAAEDEADADLTTAPPPLPADWRPSAKPAKPITLKLVMECSLQTSELAEFKALGPEETLDFAGKLKTLHLEWQGISEMENLDVFEGAETIYLQRNQISCIQGLESLEKLQFLALQYNQISKLENLRHLSNLDVLDVSGNFIEELDEHELPESLTMLNMKGNPCTSVKGYRERLQARLPGLVYLDGEDLSASSAAGDEAARPASAAAQTSIHAAAEEVVLTTGEKGMPAYYRRDELRSGLAEATEDKIQAYSVEALADVAGLGERADNAVERSRVRQRELKAAPVAASMGSSLSKEQMETVRRLSASIRRDQEQQAAELEAAAAGGNDGGAGGA